MLAVLAHLGSVEALESLTSERIGNLADDRRLAHPRPASDEKDGAHGSARAYLRRSGLTPVMATSGLRESHKEPAAGAFQAVSPRQGVSPSFTPN